jgi:N-acetylmuramoyl-L-alanine amidase
MIHYLYNTPNFGAAKLQKSNVKRSYLIIVCFLGLFLCPTSGGWSKGNYKIKTIVIDAGHGGHDSGCLGASSKEKHIALDIALKLGKLIESNYPDVNVVYTRKTDVFIPLHERANIANRAHADLFICIHLNSGGKGAYGAETYVMGNHKTEDNLEVAKRENSAILLEDDYKTQYDGFDPNSPEANIIFSLYQSQFMNQSLLLAANIQDEFESYAGRYNRGVKQAGFLVLYKTAMPAVLIECGFLSHDPEEKYLASDKGQTVMAQSIYRAFKAYKMDMETPVLSESNGNGTSRQVPVVKKEEPPVKQEVKVDSVRSLPSEKPTTKAQEPELEKERIITPPTAPKATAPEIRQPAPVATASSVFITVQVGASKNPSIDNAKYLKNPALKAVNCTDGFTRYVAGIFTDVTAARKKLSQIKSEGYPDAFLTAFNGNQRITVQEAEQILRKP